MPVARRPPVRLPSAGRIAMRSQFVLLLVVVVVGLVYFSALGVLHR